MRRRRWSRRLFIAGAVFAVVLITITLATLRTGDRALYPASAGQPTVTVFVVSHGYHAGIVLPRGTLGDMASRRGYAALVAVSTRFGAYPFLEVGWGAEEFYRSAPTIAAVTVSMAARALFLPGNRSVLHVVGLSYPPRAAFPLADIIPLELSEHGFDRMLTGIDATFAPAEDSPVEDAGAGLYGPSRFYRARGTFNIFHVCNHWLADLLDAAGVPTAPVLATLPPGLFLDLEWRAGLRPLPRQ
ncbi:MAG: DUF2459 domain-containing protein [Hyphomicrobiales bacterium]|nr:DUF2459 domain-containing protein [Hyphomicrobiales bacterium]MBV8827064.1 DUF2459 domain-containing protein [Hyphomicrobiales bacterium]